MSEHELCNAIPDSYMLAWCEIADMCTGPRTGLDNIVTQQCAFTMLSKQPTVTRPRPCRPTDPDNI